MNDKRLEALAAELGQAPPSSLSRLADDQLNDLCEAVGQARRRQVAELQAAGEQAFSLLPKLLRAPVRRLMR